MIILSLSQSFQAYHKEHYPELTKSFPAHGKAVRYINHAQWHRQQRDQIADMVRQIFSQAKTQQDFLTLLQEQQLYHYERNGTPTGIEYDDVKLRFSRLLERGQFETLPIDRSEEDATLQEIQRIREKQQTRDREDRDIEDRAR